MPAYIAYSRCSTEEQGRKGHSHEYQVDGIRRSVAVKRPGAVRGKLRSALITQSAPAKAIALDVLDASFSF